MARIMRLYYCRSCGHVIAANIHDIDKHDLPRPEHEDCKVCSLASAYEELLAEELQ